MGQKLKLAKTKGPNEYQKFIQQLLWTKKFLVGQELRKALTEQFKIKDDNARKIMQRASLDRILKTSEPLTFGTGQYVYLLETQPLNIKVITAVCKKFRPPVFRLLELLRINKGIISYFEGLKVTAALEGENTTKVNSLTEILSLLSKLNLVYEVTDKDNFRYIALKKAGKEIDLLQIVEMMRLHLENMILDSTFLPDITGWFRKCNLIDNLNIRFRNKNAPHFGVEHNKLTWDGFAYTKTTGINPILGSKADSKEKQTLVVLEVLISRELTILDVDGFYSRVQIHLRSVKSGVRKVMPIIVYSSITAQAYRTLKSLGFLAFDMGSIFGSRIYEIMEKMQKLKEFQSMDNERIQDAIASTLEIIDQSGQSDSLTAIRGALFEYLMYPVLSTIFPKAQIEQGKKLNIPAVDEQEAEGYEYDYIIRTSAPKENVIVELKGYRADATVPLGSTDRKDRGSLKWFFQRSLPFASRHPYLKDGEGTPLKAVFITSGTYYEDGFEFLEDLNKGSFRSNSLDLFYDGAKLMDLLKKFSETKAIDIIEKFYQKKAKNGEDAL